MGLGREAVAKLLIVGLASSFVFPPTLRADDSLPGGMPAMAEGTEGRDGEFEDLGPTGGSTLTVTGGSVRASFESTGSIYTLVGGVTSPESTGPAKSGTSRLEVRGGIGSVGSSTGGLLFADDFESGNTLSWDVAEGASGEE